ncbi:MAG: V-type ATP synthase subunit D [Candidatus Omnitrophica bacterium]|nr:V-type ATP synthase subunit D [Candidatus Omnitrophota bacterium]MBU1048009.1 V-type ATP synthase subunit D [Candidatus Omnitrophota bacterium]MBU1630433.1 V-type ATP synthase subunit D [Candidatus Omnitrophota bacterium]MBU1766768.1 V-type ATP synthase subunit D [Candidatus Omnitrophota bacterium]MBU1889379.1 V-type ATP synthase subunit D [Candidatus Omnitrophota bacterium]
MKLNVSATRMELLLLRKRLDLARRGCKLLRDKLDELVGKFLSFAKNGDTLRDEVEENWLKLLSFYILARGQVQLNDIGEALINRTDILEIEKEEQAIFNLRLPFLRIKKGAHSKLNLMQYGVSNTTGELDSCLRILEDITPKMLELASVEKAILLIGEEIKKTRRKVNALEYKMIPDIKETISYISFRLSEIERENFIRLMKVKERMENG